MKWLLITTFGKNPGDEFIRVGINNIIKEIDKDAEIYGIDKETPGIHKEINFDKCILAGMPVFWSFYDNNFWSIDWWKAITGWLSKAPQNFCILGAGSFQNWSNIYEGVNVDEYKKQLQLIKSRCHKIVLRDPIPNIIGNENFDVLPCPAIYAPKKYDTSKTLKLCNLMYNGSHYNIFNKQEASIWSNILPEVSKILLKNNFKFVSHNNQETALAQHLGWHIQNIIQYDGTPKSLLKYYRNCYKFFGNRVHGAITSRYNSADVLSCGYDTRQEAVRLAGGKVLKPSELNVENLNYWCETNSTENFDIKNWHTEYTNILNEFKNT